MAYRKLNRKKMTSFWTRFIFSILVLACIIAWTGCCCPDHNTTLNKSEKQQPTKSSSVEKGKKVAVLPENGMKIGFTHPVVMVDGKRAAVSDDPQKVIEVIYPVNSTQDISLVVVDPEGKEQTLQGQIKVFGHTQYTKPETLVLVVPDDPETTYYDIVHSGYGEISVCEYIQRPESIEEKGQVLLQLVLGSKKKINQSMIEVQFREDSVDKVSGQPVFFILPENSRQEFLVSLEQGEFKAKGDLQVFRGNFYTTFAPIWVELNSECKDSLRRLGEVTLALYVPSAENQAKETKIIMVDPTDDIHQITQQYGLLVGVLKFRRITG